MKYADQPDRFMDSEADLDEAVKALMVVASAPDLYPELVARWGADCQAGFPLPCGARLWP